MKLNILKDLLLKNNKFIFYGSEEYFLSYAIEILKQKLNPDFSGFNYIEIDQRTEAYNEAIVKLQAVPLMDEFKVVHIKNFNFAQGTGNNWSKEELGRFIDVSKMIDKGTTLVLSNMAMEVTKSKGAMPKLMKELSLKMEVFPFERLSQYELEDFIEKSFISLGGEANKLKKLDIKNYIDTTGYIFKDSKMTIFEVRKDIEKLVAISRQGKEINQELIGSIFRKGENADIFRLMDSIFKINKNESFVLMEGLLGKGEPIGKIAVTIGNTLSSMIKSSYLLDMGYTQAMIAESLSKHPYVIKSGLENLNRIGRKNAIDCLDELLKLDLKLKTGKLIEEAYPLMILMNLFKVLELEKNQDVWAM